MQSRGEMINMEYMRFNFINSTRNKEFWLYMWQIDRFVHDVIGVSDTAEQAEQRRK